MTAQQLQELFLSQPSYRELLRQLENRGTTVGLDSLVGSSYSLVAAGAVRERGGVHVFVMEDRDAAGYLYNDLSPFLDEERLLFFPTAYKRSIQFGQEDPSGIVQRTAALNAVKNFTDGYLAICTYPEALVEKVVGMQRLRESILTIRVGDTLSTSTIEEILADNGFERVEFVYEPGQYSVRGGIVDIFSFSDNKPYRIDLFGDEVDSIRHFDLSSQLSVDRLQQIEVVPNLKDAVSGRERVSFPAFAAGATYWLDDGEYTLKRFQDIRTKLLGELDDPAQIDTLVTGRKGFLADTAGATMVLLKDNCQERAADATISFHTSPQPQFNKKFELLADDIRDNREKGYTTCLLTENKAQIERLRNIFNSMGERDVPFEAVGVTLHAGFIDHASRYCFYTDHQLFDRYHRYQIRGGIDRSESLTIQELNELKVGDYVVHIDHGVGRFGGLTRTVENGKVHEAIKLVYRDNDVLLVNVHALHRISKYKDKDSEPPKIYKLGSGAWQRMKQNTKKAVKDIARELIALYARRKASDGFAFSPDSFLQYELEASFIYEDTPDQLKATQEVKADMERDRPMDRLVCGDVGFGKTEVAVRAAFKAVCDNKQVAVLVPTTVLAYQHYCTFRDRLKDFPCRVDYLSRARKATDVRRILKELKEGEVNILVGTHRLIGKDVHFKDLGLLVIDEEQKFGVAVKEKLKQLKVNVDTLTMTATPIPRTLQFSLMGARDMSVIQTPPPNRYPVQTEVHTFNEEIIAEAINFEMSRNGQVFFVNNRISNLEELRAMVTRLVPDARVCVGHGQMPPEELERVIMSFVNYDYDVLIATTIIESGIDIPNANTIIINQAQNFGLSDLHQMRGRVGRSNKKAFCYLLAPPLSTLPTESRRRLQAIENFSDLGSGIHIAMQDLDIRGAGNLLGAEQSGFIADLGYETYQKILAEAVTELKNDEFASLYEGDTQAATGEARLSGEEFVTDCTLESDLELLFPDSYVPSSSERMLLYRELDNLELDSDVEAYRKRLEDRFGALPHESEELLKIVPLRRMGRRLGIERIFLKSGRMSLYFVSNPDSPYFQSEAFGKIISYMGHNARFCNLREQNGKRSLVVRDVDTVEKATVILREIMSMPVD